MFCSGALMIKIFALVDLYMWKHLGVTSTGYFLFVLSLSGLMGKFLCMSSACSQAVFFFLVNTPTRLTALIKPQFPTVPEGVLMSSIQMPYSKSFKVLSCQAAHLRYPIQSEPLKLVHLDGLIFLVRFQSAQIGQTTTKHSLGGMHGKKIHLSIQTTYLSLIHKGS